MNYFKTVKITPEPGSAPDRVVLNVDVEEQSTGEFSVSGGYSTSDGFLADVSVAERNLMGRGLYGKAAIQYGQYTRGFTLSFADPYFLGYRVGFGVDLYGKKQLPTSYVSYTTNTLGGGLRFGFQLREDLSLQLRYSLYSQSVSVPPQYANCNNINPDFVNTFPTPYTADAAQQATMPARTAANCSPIAIRTAKRRLRSSAICSAVRS